MMDTTPLNRRKALSLLAVGAAGLFAGQIATADNRPPPPPDGRRPPPGGRMPPPPDDMNTPLPDNGLGNPQCYAKAEQTEGPYFVDERLNRRDIRTDPATGVVSTGIPLQITVQLANAEGGQCAALPNAMIDIWHCDAHGNYSDVDATSGQKFLRGYQMTDANGRAQFTTIYPGFYPGRAVHIHFKVRWTDANQQAREFTSQWYFDDALSDSVFKNRLYPQVAREVRNDGDFIYRRGGKDLTLQLTGNGQGYAAFFSMGLLKA